MKAQKTGSYLRRKKGNRTVSQRFLIVSEGEKTEPSYFKGFRVPSMDIVVVGTGDNTINVVEQAIDLREKAKRKGDPYDQVWAVFDKDSFPPEDFNNAVYKAEEMNLLVAESNEAFELWFLLHYNLYDTAITRQQYNRILSGLLSEKYDKACKNMYDRLISMQQTAIDNADKLMISYPPHFTPSEKKPFTRVHLLVKELIKFSKR